MFSRFSILVFCFPLLLHAQTADIVGNDTICDNGNHAIVEIYFTGNSPFTFSYLINGVMQPSITTQANPYIISTFIAGVYTLQSFNDANSLGTITGSALVTILESPTAIIYLPSDTLSVLHPLASFNSQSIPSDSIVNWYWDFGDNTLNTNIENVTHQYLDSLAIYETTLIVEHRNGCLDTAIRSIWVEDKYFLYVPSSFTPDNDKKNDSFCIEYDGIRENTFLFNVYNSQGDLMYKTTNPHSLRCCKNPPSCTIKGGWDGTHYDSEDDLLADTYIYEIYFQDFEGWKHIEYGNIVLIK